MIYFPKTIGAIAFYLLSHYAQAANASLDGKFINFAVQYYPPFTIEHASDQGVIIDVFNHFASQYNYQPNYLIYPEKRSSVAIEKGNVDVRMESEKWYRGTMQMCWSDPIYIIEDVVVTHRQAEEFDVADVKAHLFLGRFGYTYPQLESYFESDTLQRKDYYSESDILSVLAGGSHKSIAFSIIGKPTLRWYQLKHPKLKGLITIRGVSDVLHCNYSLAKRNGQSSCAMTLTAFLSTLKKRKNLIKYC
ncbi:amino acid ABC transporter substrate-binding protein [Pseudoalteromonas piscicida]|uniref:amino acid ABC transporter substrate-binding protein n=1 Tax=Pseudoalteromonas piscicida TaxID=43662 RepID=UPI001F5B0452|nr:amino acid ABC transporter substrate-binding protein [Pseudoalteromonas piscicida]